MASQFVEIGQGHGGIIIAGAQRLVGVVVRNDKEDIRFFIFLSSGSVSYTHLSNSFANQVLAQLELWNTRKDRSVGVEGLPKVRDEEVARLDVYKRQASSFSVVSMLL